MSYEDEFLLLGSDDILVTDHTETGSDRTPGDYSTEFYTGRLRPGSSAYPSVYHFDRNSTPFVLLELKERYPFHIDRRILAGYYSFHANISFTFQAVKLPLLTSHIYVGLFCNFLVYFILKIWRLF